MSDYVLETAQYDNDQDPFIIDEKPPEHFIVTYPYNQFEKFALEQADQALILLEQHLPKSNIYLIRYYEHRDEWLPESIRIDPAKLKEAIHG